MKRHLAAFALCFFWFVFNLSSGLSQDAVTDHTPRWWKGNLHTHSLWSDGDDFPEMIAAWYLEHGYNFLALSDHNILSTGVRWMPLSEIVDRSDDGVLKRYSDKFGASWVETRPATGSKGNDSEKTPVEVRLKPLDEFRCLVEQAGKFIMIQGEEISDTVNGKPLHINATNLQELIRPVGGANMVEAMQNNLRVILEQEARTGRQILPHLNHPNFGYALTAQDIGHVIQERFFEVYNGHPGVNQLGNEEHMSIERMWDVANAIRLAQLDAPPLLGIATDDSHEYHGREGARPGRGWVMVRARHLTPEHLILAMKQADFYASSGVVLDEINYNAESKTLSLVIPAVSGVQFTTEFVATLKPATSNSNDSETSSPPAIEQIGKVVASSNSLTPSYTA
jgi:hypothetical protein